MVPLAQKQAKLVSSACFVPQREPIVHVFDVFSPLVMSGRIFGLGLMTKGRPTRWRSKETFKTPALALDGVSSIIGVWTRSYGSAKTVVARRPIKGEQRSANFILPAERLGRLALILVDAQSAWVL